MPTNNPRVNVTLSESTDALVTRMAELQRSSRSAVIRELLDACVPSFRRAVALMEAAEGAAQGLRDSITGALEAEQAHAEKVLADRLKAIDGVTADLVEQAQAVKARRLRRTGASQAAAGVATVPGVSRARPRSGRAAPPPSKRGGK